MSLSIKNGIQLLSLLNMVNVPVVLMQLQLSSVSIRLFLAIPLILQDYQIGSGLSESFEVDSCVVRVSSQSRDILSKKHHL